MNKRFLFVFLFIISLLSCQNEKSTTNLGQVNLKVTGAEAAQQHFKNGLLYLHSFEYLEARMAFIKAQQIDPEFGMAYWGELMAYNQPLFNKEFLKLAQKTINRLGASKKSRQRLFKTEIEKDLFESVEILYGSGTKAERNNAYSQYFEKLTKKYPKNHEVSAFYALSLLSSPRNDKTEDLYNRSARIAQSIIDENPKHPGALHYLIHSYDFPSHAHLGVLAADTYAKVAPDATHALHMPSHIYLALGRWNDVVNSNIDSWNASVKATQKQPKKELGYHSLSWLHYGLLQRKETELAQTVMNQMIKHGSSNPTILARSYLVAMKGLNMVETNTWSGSLADLNFKIDDLHLTKQSGFAYLEGMKAFHKKDKVALKEIIKQLGLKKYTASLNLGDEAVAMCNIAGNPSIPPNKLDIDLVTILELELEAALLDIEGKNAEALSKLEQGVNLYESLKMSYGPPIIFKPIHEAYAEALIKNNNLDKSLEIINRGLEILPLRFNALKIKETILDKLAKHELLEETREKLNTNSSKKPRAEILAS